MRSFLLTCLMGLLVSAAAFSIPGVAQTSKGTAGLRIEKIEFVYRADADARFLDLKTDWLSSRRGEISLAKTAELADRADEQANVEKTLETWRQHGGPNPNVLYVRVHLYNNSSEPRLNLTLNTQVRVRTGELLVHPRTLITDFDHLKKTATWQTLHRDSQNIPVMTPGEDQLVLIYRFNLPQYLNDNPDQWPVELEVSSDISGANLQKTSRLTLLPDHFTLRRTP